MSAYVLLNLLNEVRKRDEERLVFVCFFEGVACCCFCVVWVKKIYLTWDQPMSGVCRMSSTICFK